MWRALSAGEVPPAVGCAVATATPTPLANCTIVLGEAERGFIDPFWVFIPSADQKLPDILLPSGTPLTVYERLLPVKNPSNSDANERVLKTSINGQDYWFYATSLEMETLNCSVGVLPAYSPTPPPFATPTPITSPHAWVEPIFTFFPLGMPSTASMPVEVHTSLFSFSTLGRGCRRFAYAVDEYNSGKHSGFDFYVPIKSAVYAMANGIIVGITDNTGSLNSIINSMAKNDSDSQTRLTAIVRHGFAYVLYSHLGGVYVRVGDTIEAGQPIGWVGAYEEYPIRPSHGSHLHLEIRLFEQTYQNIVNSGLIGTDGSGIITPNASSASSGKPFRVAHAFEYFTASLKSLLDACVGVAQNSLLYAPTATPIPFVNVGKPNGLTTVLPSQQEISCFKDIAGQSSAIPFSICNTPPLGAPSN